MSEVLEVTDSAELEALLANSPEAVVKFTAPAWCQPCKQLAPHFKAAAEKTDIPFISVDIDQAVWATGTYGVRGVPTVMHYRNGEYVKNLQGRTAIKLLSEIKDS